MDRAAKKVLQQYAQVFHDGRQRSSNEADTAMYVVRFFTDVLGYDVFSEITRELQIRERYCDVAVKIEGQVRFLIEVKAMATTLSDRHIEQAENYASRSGIQWVVLTNGISWRLYHLTFDAGGIEHDVAFDTTLTPESDLDAVWKDLYLLSRESLVRGVLEKFWLQKKTLRPDSLVRALFTEEVLNALRRELHRKSETRLDVSDVAASVRRLLNPEVLTEDIKIRKGKKKRKKAARAASQVEGDEVTGEDLEEVEVAEPADDDVEEASTQQQPAP